MNIQTKGQSSQVKKLNLKTKSSRLADSKFTITVLTNGSYNLNVNNVTWLSSAETSLRANGMDHSNVDQSLVLNLTSATAGYDVLGHYERIDYYYVLNDDVSTEMTCSITTYDDNDLVRFTQVNYICMYYVDISIFWVNILF